MVGKTIFHIRQRVIQVLIGIFPAFVIFIIQHLYLIRFGIINPSRIGHLALDIEISRINNQKVLKQFSIFGTKDFYFSSKPIANKYLWNLWKNNGIHLYKSSLFVNSIIFCLSKLNKEGKFDSINYGQIRGHRNLTILDGEKSLLEIPESDLIRAKKTLNELGLDEKSKVVCLVVRDAKYLKTIFPDTDGSYHSLRDSDIDDYIESANYLASLGYYVFRMGKIVEKVFLSTHPRVFDYANSDIRSDFMDIFLLSTAHFTISTSSGPDAVSSIFRRPIGLINTPHKNSLSMGNTNQLFHPKFYRDIHTGQYLSVEQLENHNWSNLYTRNDFYEVGIEVESCTSKEILDFCIEFEKLIQKPLQNFTTLDEDENLKLKLSSSWVNYVLKKNDRKFK
jgi:putative glycosyltransferase (TIGR04372 family)